MEVVPFFPIFWKNTMALKKLYHYPEIINQQNLSLCGNTLN